ncbi:unnamed protein product [Durusdinium trenchii]|uniref:Uncharacterized protein n=1 Tax=Durusdinium trenchii TaxID=1381693 RepID=A0ABP0HZL9_9DINO
MCPTGRISERGLEVRTPDGKWISAPGKDAATPWDALEKEGAVVLNTGAMLARWCNDFVKDPLPEFTRVDAKKYGPITAEEYLRQCLNGSSDAFIGIAESIGFRVVSRNTQNTFEGLLLFWAEKYPVDSQLPFTLAKAASDASATLPVRQAALKALLQLFLAYKRGAEGLCDEETLELETHLVASIGSILATRQGTYASACSRSQSVSRGRNARVGGLLFAHDQQLDVECVSLNVYKPEPVVVEGINEN